MSKGSQLVVSGVPVSVDYLVDEVRKRTSLEAVMACAPVQDLAKGGEFSTSQHALIASVVSVMQDKFIDLAQSQVDTFRQELREQRNFVTEIVGKTTTGLILGLRNGWRAPLVTENAQPVGDEIPPTLWGRIKAFLNWGNFATAAGVLVLCVALYYTKAYSSLKDRVENQSHYVTELESQNQTKDSKIKTDEASIATLTKQLTDANAQDAIDSARYQTVADQLNKQAGSATDLQTQLTSQQAKVADLSAKAASDEARMNAAQNDATTFNKLYEQERTALSKAEDNSSALNKENEKLALQLQACKSKHP